MKIIKVKDCSECPYCKTNYFDSWIDIYCTKFNKILLDYPNEECELEEYV